MYSVGVHDRVEKLKRVPQSDVGDPSPVVLADEDHVLLAYLISEVSEADPNWKGYDWNQTDVNAVSPDAERDVAIVSFDRPSLHMSGPPNDEAFGGHPLAARGLRPYSVFEVHNSSWLKMRIEMNRVHHRHSDSLYDDVRHFIFAFHDSTFECLACDFSVSTFRGSINSAIERMTTILADS